MANDLTALLRLPPAKRGVPDYEKACDDFVAFAGGVRVDQRFPVPEGTLNADYYFELDACDLILEMKQLHSFRPGETVDAYFSERLRQGKVRKYTDLGNGQIRIDPESLSRSDWNHFYKRFRPSVSGQLHKAARQLKATKTFLPESNRPRIGAVFLVNSGDYNLSTDLFFRLVEWRMKNEWRRGLYSAVDFVSCVTMDMVQEGRHPLHARHIALHPEDMNVTMAARYLFDRWVHYGAAALGMTVTFNPTAEPTDDPIDVSTKTLGKLRYTPD